MKTDNRPGILLAYPSCFYYPTYMDRIQIKTSQLLLASYLAQYFPVEYADFEITIGRPNTEIQIKRYKRKVREFLNQKEFDILALSCWTSLSYQATLTTARICRELHPDKLIIVGGYHPTARPHEFITEDNAIDYVIWGEGELALKEIAENFKFSTRPDKTEIVRAPIFDKEHFVGHDWSLVHNFIKSNFAEKFTNVFLFLSRGCPFGCSFCMEPIKDRQWRAFSPLESIAEIENAVEKYNPFAFAISDACFGMRPVWRKEFLERLVALKPEFWVIFETRPEYLDADDIKLISNLKVEIQLGIESCSPEMLLVMKKTRQPDKFLKKFREVSHMMSDYDILHRANLILNHPGETRKTLQETFTFIDEELSRRNKNLIWACHGYMHFPGCELDTNKEFYEQKYGSRFLSNHWWTENTDQYENSMRFIPSSDFNEDNVSLWKQMFDDRQEAMKSSLTDRAFRFAARKYFMDWQDDPRYKND